jgi:hypothetical protein
MKRFPEILKVLPLVTLRKMMHQEEPVKETSPQVSDVVELSNMEFQARCYQLEMLDRSLERNVIVAVR